MVLYCILCLHYSLLVSIQIQRIDTGIEFTVYDDGEGISNDQFVEIIEVPLNEKSIGLYNVNKRLEKMYGRGLYLRKGDQGRFGVSFVIPEC